MTENQYSIGSESKALSSTAETEMLIQRLRQYLELRNVGFLIGNGCSLPLGAPSISDVGAIRLELESEPYKLSEARDQSAALRLLDLLLSNGRRIALEPLLALLTNLRANGELLNVPQQIAGWSVNTGEVESLERLLKKWLYFRCAKLSAVAEADLASHQELFRRILLRSTGLPRCKIFTTNYDLVIERALDSLGVMYFDGFLGTIQRSMRTESYHYDLYFPGETTEGRVSRVDRVLHMYKLHGSINWRRSGAAGLDVVARHDVPSESEIGDVMVYPSPLKLTEMNGYPYAEMLRHFSSHIHQPQSVLFTVGYSFRDEHINRLIYQALAVPSFVLVIVVPEINTPADGATIGPEHEVWRLIHKVSSRRVVAIVGGQADADGRYLSGAGTLQDFAQLLMPDIRELDVRRVVASELANVLGQPKDEE